MVSTDPDLEQKAADIIGFYLKPLNAEVQSHTMRLGDTIKFLPSRSVDSLKATSPRPQFLD
jgi:hypothetical protein